MPRRVVLLGAALAAAGPARADTHGPDPSKVTPAQLRVFPVPAFYTRGANPYQDALDAARDILTLPESDRCYYRYLSFYNLPEKERKPFAEYVLRYHLNLLSRETDFAFGVWVTATVLRIDLRDFAFDRGVWDRSAAIDPYFHVRALVAADPERPRRGKRRRTAVSSSGHHWTMVRGEWERTFDGPTSGARQVAEYDLPGKVEKVDALAPWLPGLPAAVLAYWTSEPGEFHCQSPILRADWFFVQTARQFSLRNDEATGFGYYDFLGVKSRDDWFRLVRLDEKLAVKARKEIRAVIDKSRVSAQNRQTVILASINGPVSGTLDVFDQSDKGIAKRNLRRGQFRHDAEEWFGFSDCGLPVTLAAAADGTLQSNAPDRIGPNDSPRRRGRDGRIHVNLACMQCHSSPDVLQPLDDWARKTYRGWIRLGAADKQVDLELKRQYLSDLKQALADANALYARGVWRCVRLTPARAADLYSAAFYRYALDEVGLDRGAEELGVSKAHFLAALKSANATVGRVDPVLVGFFKVPDYKVSRLEWEDVFGVAASVVAGYVPPDE